MTQTFAYDMVGRLCAADGPWGALRWTYDAAGNRVTETRGPDRLQLRYADAAADVDERRRVRIFTYDSAGRLASDSRGTYSYNGVTSWLRSPRRAARRGTATSRRAAHGAHGQRGYDLHGAGRRRRDAERNRTPCGAMVWARDGIYAAGRPLGAVRTTPTHPTSP